MHWETAHKELDLSAEYYESLTEQLLTWPQERILKGMVDNGGFGHRNLIVGQSYCIFITWLLRFMKDD